MEKPGSDEFKRINFFDYYQFFIYRTFKYSLDSFLVDLRVTINFHEYFWQKVTVFHLNLFLFIRVFFICFRFILRFSGRCIIWVIIINLRTTIEVILMVILFILEFPDL